MLGELNRTGVSTLKATRKIADSVKELAGWGLDEIKDAAELSKEVNQSTRGIRKTIALSDYELQLNKQEYKIAKSKAKFEAKKAASELNMKAGETNANN